MKKKSLRPASLTLVCLIEIFSGCGCASSDTTTGEDFVATDSTSLAMSTQSKDINELDQKRQKIKLGHSINTAANEYLPILDPSESKLYFSGMDRTGFFDFKLDFTKEKSAGGEDIFLSEKEEGIWADARPIISINTNGHEVVSQAFNNGDLLVTANYPENLGVKNNSNAGVYTTDIFFLKKSNGNYQINHLPEPVNSIFTEADGWMSEDKTFILFVSDRPGNVGEYKKKGWNWNESFWGNTDIYVSVKDGDFWSVPLNLGPLVNTQYAERTPWLSKDGLTLYLSSNGYIEGKTDLDVYAFKRTSRSDWTTWSGPCSISDANTQYDDWGYKETESGIAFLASAEKLNYKPTQRGAAGAAGIRETNFRTGYELFGLQIAALNSEFETNIYSLVVAERPSFTIDEVFFDFNSSLIKKQFERYLLLIADQIGQNKSLSIEIHGHTDNIGNAHYNQELSIKRAESIKKLLIENGIQNSIIIKGHGVTKPISIKNDKVSNAKNRRVEIFLK